MTDKDVTACYDMSLKDFEHSDVHDPFKVCELFFIPHPISSVYMCTLSNQVLIYVGNV